MDVFFVFPLTAFGLFVLIYLGGLAIQAIAGTDRIFAILPETEKFLFVFVEGRFDHLVENSRRWKLDGQNRFRRSPHEESATGFWEQKLGVSWIGLYGRVKIFEKWQWAEFRQKKDSGGKPLPDWGVVSREKDVREFLIQFTYSIPVNTIELQGNDQISANVLVTTYILDPEKFFLGNKDAMDVLVGTVQGAVRGWASSLTMDEVKRRSGEAGRSSEFAQAIIRTNGIELSDSRNPDTDGDPDYSRVEPGSLFDVTGVAIWNVTLQDIEATGPVAEAQSKQRKAELEGAAKVTEAEKAAEAALIRARNEAEVLNLKAAAEAAYIQATIVLPTGGAGPHVAEILKAQAVTGDKSKLTTWVEKGGGASPTLPIK